MVRCPNGHDNPDGAKFCNECGAAIGVHAPAPAPSPPRLPDAPRAPEAGGPEKPWWRRPAGMVGIAVALLLLVGGIGSAMQGDRDEPRATEATNAPSVTATATPSVEPEATESPEPTESSSPSPPPPVADPDGTYTTSCDYLLGNFTQTAQGYRAIATAKIRNTGNIGITLEVTARWDMTGRPSLKLTKTVDVPYHSSKKVDFSEVLSSDELDAMQDSALSFDDWCGVKATITDSFGAVHG